MVWIEYILRKSFVSENIIIIIQTALPRVISFTPRIHFDKKKCRLKALEWTTGVVLVCKARPNI